MLPTNPPDVSSKVFIRVCVCGGVVTLSVHISVFKGSRVAAQEAPEEASGLNLLDVAVTLV